MSCSEAYLLIARFLTRWRCDAPAGWCDGIVIAPSEHALIKARVPRGRHLPKDPV